MIGGLHPVRVPTLGEEALRDLVRARQDVGGELMRARHRLSKLLLRHDVRCGGARVAWTQRHRQWLTGVDLAERSAQAALLDYIRDRRGARQARHTRGHDRRARPRLALG